MKRPTTVLAVACLALVAFGAPVFAQIDLSGAWSPVNASDILPSGPGPMYLLVDYTGLPLNSAGRAAALMVAPDKLSEPDRICAFYPPTYLMFGPFSLEMTQEIEPRNGQTVAWHIGGWEDLSPFTIWVDGRPHPSQYAPHEMAGFTTGQWQDDVLVSHTTHMRFGEIRRTGVPSSDKATFTMWFLRHGDELTLVAQVEDPIYLAEPLTVTRTFVLAPRIPIPSGPPCTVGDEGVPEGDVPFYLPGKNPVMDEVTKQYGIPEQAVLGGPETMYPQIRKELASKYVRPEKCTTACGGAGKFPQTLEGR